MEYYSATKRNEALILVTIQMNLENMLSDRSQTQRSPIMQFHSGKMSRIHKSVETESREA